MAIKDAERRRLSFGAVANDYDRYRPTYPREAVEWVLPDDVRVRLTRQGKGADSDTTNAREHASGEPRLAVVRGPRLMDVGAGTGLLTRVLVAIAADMSPPGHVTAVEPDPGMAMVLGQRLPTVRVIPAPAEHIDAGDQTLDCIVVGQAFHWFDREAAVGEFARLLRPGGRLGVMWNVRHDSEPWVDALGDIVDGEDHTRDRSTTRDADSMSVGFDPHGLFDKVERTEFAHSLTLDAEHLLGLVDTFSYVRLSPDRDAILGQVRELTQTHPDLVGMETFELPYLTITYRATRP